MNGAQNAALDHVALRQAAQWLMRLHAGAEPGPETFQEWERWRGLSPDNELAWQRAQQLSARLDSLPPALARPALARPMSRRKALASLGGLLIAPPAAWAAWKLAPWAAWTAEYRTATGDRRDVRLADGSLVQMNTDSAMDIAFDDRTRRVLLHSGELLVRTAPDVAHPDAGRPFLVSSDAGSIGTLDARFTVRLIGERCRVAVLEGAVDVTPRQQPGQRLTVAAGQCLHFDAQGASAIEPAPAGADDWSRGVLIAQDMRLSAFLDELSRYRPGILRCDPSVAGLRLSGGFQLADTDRVLALLPVILPVQVVTRTRYWVSVQGDASRA